jgi:hypothetical protein
MDRSSALWHKRYIESNDGFVLFDSHYFALFNSSERLRLTIAANPLTAICAAVLACMRLAQQSLRR